MGENLTPCSLAIGEENICFLTPHFRLIKREKIDDKDFLKTNKCNVAPFSYHVRNCGENFFRKSRIFEVHSNYD